MTSSTSQTPQALTTMCSLVSNLHVHVIPPDYYDDNKTGSWTILVVALVCVDIIVPWLTSSSLRFFIHLHSISVYHSIYRTILMGEGVAKIGT